MLVVLLYVLYSVALLFAIMEYIDVTLVEFKDDAYVLQAKDGTMYNVPTGAFPKIFHNMIIPVDEKSSIRVWLEPSGPELMLPSTTVNSPQSLTKKKLWLTSSIRSLLEAYKEHKKLFGSTSIKADEVWKKIQTKMANDKKMFTIDQIKTKFSKLKQTYLKVKDNNNKTGASPMEFQFMEEFDEIFEKDHDVTPCAVASSSKFVPIGHGGNVPLKGPKTNVDKILDTLTNMQRQREERRAERDMERREERQEILNALRLNNEVFKKMLEKMDK